MDSSAEHARKRLFKPRIQNRLLLAFVAVAVVPMTVALYAVVKLNEGVLEREIQAKLEAANVETGALIAERQDEALKVATALVDDPEFAILSQRKTPTPFEPPVMLAERQLVGFWVPDPAPGVAAASDEPPLPAEGVRTLMITSLNGVERLLGGAVVPVQRNGARVGQLAVGTPLGKSFAQDVEIQTGVVARVYHHQPPQQMVRMLFSADAIELSDKALEQAPRIAQIIRDNPQVNVILEGHTDDTGDARHNYHLSQRRTLRVARALAAEGVPMRRITRLNYGESRPVAHNENAAGRAMNRRVDVRFVYEDEELGSIQDLPLTGDVQDVLFAKRQPYYDKRATLKGEPYRALYQPLVSRNGKVVGMLFLGIPHQYTFAATVSTWRFYPLWLFLGVIMALGLGYMVSRSISRPLRRFVLGVRQVADGNIDLRFDVASRDELGEMAQAFNEMTHELRSLRARESEFRRRDRLAALGEMAAGIAHEVRNPLNVMRNAAQRLLRRAPDESPDLQEMSRYIIEEVDRLNRVVSQFLTFARNPLPEPRPTDVNALLKRTMDALAPEADAAHVRVRWQLDPGMPPALLDPEQGYRVLFNLAQNAFQQMEPLGGGELTLKTRSIMPSEDTGPGARGFVQIEVADTGPGIPTENLDRVFNPFFTTREHGVGLGLSLVHNIIAAHNGEITVSSTPGEGTAFVISLPVAFQAPTPVAEDDAPPVEAPDTEPAETALRPAS